MSGDDRSAGAALLRGAAAAAEPFYRVATALRNRAFDFGLRVTAKAHCPVISVGNLTTGGTGKTPMVVHLVELLQRHGRAPAVVLRGYKQTDERPSDEATLLREALPGVAVVVNGDRVAAARQVARRHAEVDVIVLDDGFQHRRIARDLDVVLIDATNPFGYGRVLPRGMMREGPGGLRRADAVVVTRSPLGRDPQAAAELNERVARYHGKPPVAHFAHRWANVVDANDAPVESVGRPAVAFCGVGNPRPFFDEAVQHAEVKQTIAFADHHHYTHDDLAQLAAVARENDAVALLTTGKDWVKLRPLLESADDVPAVWRAELELACLDGGAALETLVLEALKQACRT